MANPGRQFAYISPTTDPLTFQGIDGIECEEFVYAIRSRARDAGKQKDNEWMLDLASSAFIGEALRWHIDLDEDVQNDWRKLQQALFKKWPAPQVRILPQPQTDPALVPFAAAAPPPPGPPPINAPFPVYRMPGPNATRVKIKTLTGKTTEIRIDTSKTVLDLKKKYTELEGIPADQQRYIYGGKQLEDQRTLISYQVDGDAPIHLVLRLR